MTQDISFLARSARPWVRGELPGWYRIYRAIGGEDDTRWTTAGERTFTSKFHRYSMPVRLSNWSERKSWFLGRYYELETQLFLRAVLRPGDTFIDVGANIGMLSLLAAELVGPSGRVHSVEPNPVPAGRLADALRQNSIAHVKLHQVGLSDRAGELELRIVGDHTGAGTFAPLDAREASQVRSAHRVPVVRGDDLLGDGNEPGAGTWTLKIDVEGFECHALRGLERTLRAHRPAVLTESIAPQLERAGSSLAELFGLLQGHGLVAHRLSTRRKGLGKELVLERLDAPRNDVSDDLAWLAPESEHARRLAGDATVHVSAA